MSRHEIAFKVILFCIFSGPLQIAKSLRSLYHHELYREPVRDISALYPVLRLRRVFRVRAGSAAVCVVRNTFLYQRMNIDDQMSKIQDEGDQLTDTYNANYDRYLEEYTNTLVEVYTMKASMAAFA